MIASPVEGRALNEKALILCHSPTTFFHLLTVSPLVSLPSPHCPERGVYSSGCKEDDSSPRRATKECTPLPSAVCEVTLPELGLTLHAFPPLLVPPHTVVSCRSRGELVEY